MTILLTPLNEPRYSEVYAIKHFGEVGPNAMAIQNQVRGLITLLVWAVAFQ